MQRTLTLLTEEAGDLLLVASLLLVVPSWVGGIELLSMMGIDSGAAAFISGGYAWGRGGLSAALLARNIRRGSLALGGAWLITALEAASHQTPLAEYPAPAETQFSLWSTPLAA